MEKVITATGKEFSCDYFVASEVYRQVNIRVLDCSFAKVAATFSMKSETSLLKYGNQSLQHHTRVKAMIPEGDAIRVILEKE